MVTWHVRAVAGVVIALRFRYAMVMVVALQTGHHAHSNRTRHHGVDAEQDGPPAETGNLLGPITLQPRPPRAHNDVTLEQQNADAAGLDRLRLTGIRTKRRPHSPRYHPQPCRNYIGNNPADKHQ